jgi:hypothetical protein
MSTCNFIGEPRQDARFDICLERERLLQELAGRRPLGSQLAEAFTLAGHCPMAGPTVKWLSRWPVRVRKKDLGWHLPTTIRRPTNPFARNASRISVAADAITPNPRPGYCITSHSVAKEKHQSAWTFLSRVLRTGQSALANNLPRRQPSHSGALLLGLAKKRAPILRGLRLQHN